MIKRTFCFSNPAYLSMKNRQLVVRLEKQGDEPERTVTIPVEDIGIVVLDNRQITLTHGLMAALLDNNASVITCDERHMPVGLMLPLEGHTVQSERFQDQLSASVPLRKQLWQQTVQLQFSIYVRHCASRENADVHLRRVRAMLPQYGQVGCLTITDKQFADIELYTCRKEVEPNAPGQQLEIF